MNTSVISPRELLMRSLRDHDQAAKHNMRIAQEHLKRGYQIARELEMIQKADLLTHRYSDPSLQSSDAG